MAKHKRVGQREQQRRQRQSRRDTPRTPAQMLQAHIEQARLMRALGMPLPKLRPYGGVFDRRERSADDD
jgi:hypothetical protein